jgi:hypothetical protein
MSLPKKFLKNININPPSEGVQRRQEWLDGIADHGTYLPRGIAHEDMDKTFNDFVESPFKRLKLSVETSNILLTEFFFSVFFAVSNTSIFNWGKHSSWNIRVVHQLGTTSKKSSRK